MSDSNATKALQQQQHAATERVATERAEPPPMGRAAAAFRLPPAALRAAAVVLDAVAVAAWQAGRLGSPPFSLQLLGTLVVLPWLPYLCCASLPAALPRFVVAAAAVGWGAACLLPSAVALFVELFTGHRRPGASWLDGVWRIYTIMALWVLLAVINERVVRPWWVANADSFLAPLRASSVAAQAHDLALTRRASVLDGIMQQMVAVSKRKILASRTLDTKSSRLQQAKQKVADLKADIKLEKGKLDDAGTSADKQRCLETVQQLTEQLLETVTRVDDLRNDVRVLKEEVSHCERQMEPLQHKWEQSLHIENHTQFYR